MRIVQASSWLTIVPTVCNSSITSNMCAVESTTGLLSCWVSSGAHCCQCRMLGGMSTLSPSGWRPATPGGQYQDTVFKRLADLAASCDPPLATQVDLIISLPVCLTFHAKRMQQLYWYKYASASLTWPLLAILLSLLRCILLCQFIACVSKVSCQKDAAVVLDTCMQAPD